MEPNEVIALKKEYFFPNSMHFYQDPPVMVKGAGQYLFDNDGKRYTDFFAGVTVVNCGHCNDYINQKVIQQVGQLQHTSVIYLTEPAVQLAQRLAEKLPGDIKNTFFCNSGTEANEGALLLARMATGRKGFIAFEGGLHGRSALTMSVTGIPMWRIDPYLDDTVYFAKGFMAHEAFKIATAEESLASVEAILKEHGNSIAACIVEPIQGNGGIHVPPFDFFVRLKDLLEAYGVLLIADEVQTGFGRTGTYFAVEHFGIVPDIITMAKALGNGIPIGAFSARPEVAKFFNKPSASTLGGNPVSATAGLAVMDVIEEQNLCERSAQLGLFLLEKLAPLKTQFEMILDIRGIGLMIGIEITSPIYVDAILESMKNKGFIVGKNGMQRNVIVFQPPLVITEADIVDMVNALTFTMEMVFAQK